MQRSAAIVGAGPAGLYVLAALLKSNELDHIDVFESVPAPYGLVRYGVAPDHPKTRTISRVLARGFEAQRVRYFGNVTVGKDVTVDELRNGYDAVIIASGMLGDRGLGIPGEGLPYSLGASELVAWYTGHPDAPPIPTLADVSAAAVVGAGNVALDVVRILTRPPEIFVPTSMPRHVVSALQDSAITDVHLFARRGPAFAKFTSPEFHEIGELDGVDVVVDPADLELEDADRAEVESRRMAGTTVKLLGEWLERGLTGARRRVHFHFWRRPTQLVGDTRVNAIETEPTRGSGAPSRLPVGLVVRSIGYHAREIPGLPPADDRGVLPSSDGRILEGHGAGDHVVPGLYVTGWLRRGPSGVIGTNRPDANEVAEAVIADLADASEGTRTPVDTAAVLKDRGVPVVTWDDWLRLDKVERTLGDQHGADPIVLHEREEIIRALYESSRLAADP